MVGGGIYSYGDVTITDSTVSGNTATYDGGGIWANGLRMSGSAVTGNDAAYGGGITGSTFNFRHRFLRVTNSTISGNSATHRGGGVGVVKQMRFEHVTVASNSAGDTGGGFGFVDYTYPVTLKASILADNGAGSGAADCYGVELRAFNGNLIEDSACSATLLGGSTILTADPELGPLQNNGGPTDTQALAPGSPAIGVVTNGALCKQRDQRGVARSVPCDLGAYEAP